MTTEERPWHETILLGMAAAGRSAVDIARQTNTKLAVWLDGRVQKMTADEWEAYEKAQKDKKDITDHVSH